MDIEFFFFFSPQLIFFIRDFVFSSVTLFLSATSFLAAYVATARAHVHCNRAGSISPSNTWRKNDFNE